MTKLEDALLIIQEKHNYQVVHGKSVHRQVLEQMKTIVAEEQSSIDSTVIAAKRQVVESEVAVQLTIP